MKKEISLKDFMPDFIYIDENKKPWLIKQELDKTQILLVKHTIDIVERMLGWERCVFEWKIEAKEKLDTYEKKPFGQYIAEKFTQNVVYKLSEEPNSGKSFTWKFSNIKEQ